MCGRLADANMRIEGTDTAALAAAPFASFDRLVLWSLRRGGQGNNWSWFGGIYEVLAPASEPDDMTR
ncbi:hypothetical protein [Ketogulonicigenium vulgare]|uniref:Uncharacterized protein n=1 Tax=Ketogulonicigenium vulgare (strain WSH-001) TaxID=759362 RepID=F9Y6B4_KETVW|nr:hypothetical protein [Ketogulonicigenium vulgare]ADO42669.1 hypothetical protein EIO_1540 [Ketogulonicigenium vulgare Y25]AEM40860.1 hypothetical protein KVU_1021 [Ketogulonicigenium vulgare WSH-001]ALJ81022.1 hypothetical protein KVH_07405 [Ketogulonicigenium vulgare]ANW35026.1 hypothetical protein KvSKV_07370 [Ketogulonicigenium vulgare]AOZ54578.1 hypothetical protein KVC_1564 [Ketogulonicigenium vulgare]